MNLPNFIVLGTAKAGTTSLSNYLNQHPQIYMSPVKEPNFFSYERNQPAFCGPGDGEIAETFVTDINNYQSLFEKASTQKAIGEASTSYLYIPEASKRIKSLIPDAKLIAILRNPADRAYASFLHLVRDGRETISDFSLALQEEKKRIRNNWMPLWHYAKRGLYYNQLKIYFDLFDRHQIKVYLYDEFKNNPQTILENIFQFLKVDPDFNPDLTTNFNISGIPKNSLLQKAFDKQSIPKSLLKKILPTNLKQKIRISNLSRPELSNLLRLELIEIYRDDILKLQPLIDQDLSHWL